MKTGEWKTYRTRFLVKAKQLSSGLSFTDHLGRQHCGRKGDYLVESFDGVLSIAPRQIFEDIYVRMLPNHGTGENAPLVESNSNHSGQNQLALKRLRFEPLEVERIGSEKLQIPARRRTDQPDPSRARRKSPQPFRASRGPWHLTLM